MKASTLILVTLLVLLLITIVGACAPSPEMIANATQQAGGAQPTQTSFFAPQKPTVFTYPDVGVACFVQIQVQKMVCLKVQ